MKNWKYDINRRTAVTAMKILLTLPVLAGWCGFLYPDIAFPEGTCKAYTAAGEEKEPLSGKAFYEELSQAKPGRIRIKSRLLELLFSE